MTQFCRKSFQSNLRRRMQRHVSMLRRCILRLLDRFLVCSLGKPARYRMLPHSTLSPPSSVSVGPGGERRRRSISLEHVIRHNHDSESDLVALKISLLGDCQIGKTSFLEKYVGDDEQEQGGIQSKGLNLMDKTLVVGGARISYCMWEVEGDKKSKGNIPLACKNSVAILFMFDLTSRCTLNSVMKWYQQARKWNQTAIPILIGTKFDDFIQLPIDLQWTIASQARAYAKAFNATLFFSSATYNINVNKIFKFITAKLFDLPWTVERNVTVGEPIIDF
ncbi:septum-promoting GTP-binding protein 1 [Quillaja saponaria]|uniref:Septum-promoting GTP-binding protein 1 n=1 Tax=Quillaja saponaria TaxID=32244 RepID=A0AAD7QGZ1_QUISA|nr:septum-promoting GTP-binding protein 1 [Quillaja saponaria]